MILLISQYDFQFIVIIYQIHVLVVRQGPRLYVYVPTIHVAIVFVQTYLRLSKTSLLKWVNENEIKIRLIFYIHPLC